MTKLTGDAWTKFNEEINENQTSKKKEVKASLQKKIQKANENVASGDLQLNDDGDLSYEAFKEKWKKRKPVTITHPYGTHAELFLACFYPEFNKELQQSIADYQLQNKTPNRFYVENSKVNFHWQLLDDRGELVNGAKVSNPLAIKSLYGTLSDHYDIIKFKNIRGANVCIAINQIEGPLRQKQFVIAILAIWLEDDSIRQKPRTATDLENPLPLPPSIIVESSRGKFHYYWLTYTEDLRTWERIQKEVLTDRLGSDPGANGLNRAMRVPGFWHSKKRAFPTRIVFLLGENNKPIEAVASQEFIEFAKTHEGAYKEYAFEPHLASQVKRYDWEEITETFGKFLPIRDLNEEYSNEHHFDILDSIENIYSAQDYHSSLHSICMHFANYKQDPEYITHIVQGLMCRVPEAHRDPRWTVRFNDVGRSASAAVTKKLQELAVETQLPEKVTKNKLKEVGIHDENWYMPFPDISGIKPLDKLIKSFGDGTGYPIKSFNFTAAISFVSLILQNIPVMPVKAQRTANGCHLLLAPSTEGKDLNTTSPLKSLRLALLKEVGEDGHSIDIRKVINGIRGNTGEITSLSAFHDWANQSAQGKGGIWINTECTSQIGKMADENLNISNIAEIPINIQDGEPIAPVNKVKQTTSNEQKDIVPFYEAVSILFATQPASIKRYMTPSLLYKGVIGRWDFYVPDRPSMSLNKDVSYISKSVLRPIKWDQELIDFLVWSIYQCCQRTKECDNGLKRRVATVFEDNDSDPLSPDFEMDFIDGPRRQKFIAWDKAWHQNELYQLDPQFNTFADRVQMSAERWMTILAAFNHLWECYIDNKQTPFQKPIVITDKIMDIALKLGDYQYEVRFTRIWPLIGSTRGLDNQHKAILEAIQKADKSPVKWLRYMSPQLQPIYKFLHESEFYIPISCVGNFLALDDKVATKDIIPIVQTLQAMGLVEYKPTKIMDARLTDKKLKNVVRLTAEGRQ